MSRSVQLQFRTPNELLFIPCYVNLNDLPEAKVQQLVDVVTEQLGARFFRDRDLFQAVLEDTKKRVCEPGKYLTAPYLHLFVRPKGELGVVAAAEKLKEGGAVYADQARADRRGD